jgi:phosphatidylserine synthase
MIKLKFFVPMIPSMITFASLLCSLTAIFFVIRESIGLAFSFIVFSFALDILDGLVARMYALESKIGTIIDSVADVPLYLLFPVVIIFNLYHVKGVTQIILSLFLFAGMWRLVRFTKEGFISQGTSMWYRGVPVYVTFPLSVILLLMLGGILEIPPLTITLIMFLAIATLMISNIHVKKIVARKTLLIIVSLLIISGTITLLV